MQRAAAGAAEVLRETVFGALEARGLTDPRQVGQLTGYSPETIRAFAERRRPVTEAFVVVVEIALKLRPGRLRPGLRFEEFDAPAF